MVSIIKDKIKTFRINKVFIILLFTILFTSIPLFFDSILYGHDIGFHLNRIQGIANALSSSQFPVRIHAFVLHDFGQAAPILYPELFLYIPAFLRMLGVSLITSYFSFILLVNAATCCISYFCFKRLFNSKYPGLIITVLYAFSIYRLTNIYLRSACGEALAMAFFPLIIYGMYEIFFGDEKNWKFAAAGFTCILQSHILSTLITVFFTIIFILIFIRIVKQKTRLKALVKTGFWVLAINLWFIIPFLQFYFHENLNLGALIWANLHEQSAYLSQILAVFAHGTGRSQPLGIIQDEMSFAIGFPLISGSFLFIYSLNYRNYISRPKYFNMGCFFLVLGLFCIMASSNIFPWQSLSKFIPALNIIQFVWRFLAFAAISLAIAAGSGIILIAKNIEQRKYMLIIIISISVLCASYYLTSYMNNPVYLRKSDALDSMSALGGGEYLPSNTNTGEIKEKNSTFVLNNNASVLNYVKNGTNIFLNYSSTEPQANDYIEVPLLYYSGYQALWNNSSRLKTEKGNNNSLRILLPDESEGSLTIKYRGFLIWDIANIVSCLAFLLFVYISLPERYRRFTVRGSFCSA